MGHNNTSTDWVTRLKPAVPDGATIITQERTRSNVDDNALAHHLLGSEFLRRQERILNLLVNEKLFSKSNQMNLSRPDRYKLGLARAKMLRRMADRYDWSDDDYEMAKYLVDDVSPYQLHTSMFRQTLREQANDEQRKYWLSRQSSWEIIGAYAQTEMGHGSNVRGIELTAHWDADTKEFILHSPTLTSSKWWNGSLGRSANHAIVVAQLMLPEKYGSEKYVSYGPHPFIVQVRHMQTNEPLPGIVIGDIGPKYGYATMDNAYMLFHKHRIPHSAMLSRYCKVDPETGDYQKPENRGVIYGSLTHARSNIVMHARLVLARAVTVAIRYTSIRRQFVDKESGSKTETAVLDYPTVQIRVLPLLASAFALHYSGRKMGEVYRDTRANVEKGQFATLIELHSLSSGLKSLCTDIAAGGIEICRRAMGGHGYGGGSGLVQLNADYHSKPTVEGDNWMITQQMARYMIKQARSVLKNPQQAPENSTQASLQRYLSVRTTHPLPFDILHDDQAIVLAFEQRAAYMTFKLRDELDLSHRTWNSLLVELHKLSRAQSEAVLVRNFHDYLNGDDALPKSTKDVVWLLYRLFSTYTLEASGRDFHKAEAVSNEQLDALPDYILSLMQQIRPHAVRLVDAWSFPDYLLDSALGRYDGRVYEDLFNRAHRLNPLNKLTFNPNYKSDEIVMGANDGKEILAKL